MANGGNGRAAYQAIFPNVTSDSAKSSFQRLITSAYFAAYVEELEREAVMTAQDALQVSLLSQAALLKELQDDAVAIHRKVMQSALTEDEVDKICQKHGIKFSAVIKAIEALNKCLKIGEEQLPAPTQQTNLQVNIKLPQKTYAAEND